MATGQLGEFTFGTNAVSRSIVEITPCAESVEDIAKPHLGLALGSHMPYEAGEIIEGGEFELLFEDDNNTNITLRTQQTCTWTKPLSGVLTNEATWAFPGYVKEVKHGPQKTGERSTIAVKVKVAGTITKTAGS